MNILLMMFIAYSIVEFIFRERLNLFKRFLLLMVILFAGLSCQRIAWEALMIIPMAGFAYFGISFFEDKMQLEGHGREFWNYALKQVAHLVAIYLIYTPFRQLWWPVGTFNGTNTDIIRNWSLVGLVVILNVWLAPRLIRYILNDLTFNTCKARGLNTESLNLSDEGAFHAGKLIGILERLLIIAAALLTVGNTGFSISLIGFILGTKSLARFKKFDKEEFVEYFIVGTLTSVLFALLSVWPLHQLLS